MLTGTVYLTPETSLMNLKLSKLSPSMFPIFAGLARRNRTGYMLRPQVTECSSAW